jgi:hypothetical protein
MDATTHEMKRTWIRDPSQTLSTSTGFTQPKLNMYEPKRLPQMKRKTIKTDTGE